MGGAGEAPMGSKERRGHNHGVMAAWIPDERMMMPRRSFVWSLGALGLAGMSGVGGLLRGADRDGTLLRLGGMTPTDTKVSGADVGGGVGERGEAQKAQKAQRKAPEGCGAHGGAMSLNHEEHEGSSWG